MLSSSKGVWATQLHIVAAQKIAKAVRDLAGKEKSIIGTAWSFEIKIGKLIYIIP